MTGTGKDWDELGRQVKLRREKMGLGQADLGPSDLTVRKLEQGLSKDLRAKTLAQIESGLDWPTGTVQKILDGTATDDDLTAEAVRDGAPAEADEERVMRLGDEISRRRSGMHMSQVDFATAAGLNQATVRRLEKGQVNLRTATKSGIEHALGWPDGIINRILDGTATDADLTQSAMDCVTQDRGDNKSDDELALTIGRGVLALIRAIGQAA